TSVKLSPPLSLHDALPILALIKVLVDGRQLVTAASAKTRFYFRRPFDGVENAYGLLQCNQAGGELLQSLEVGGVAGHGVAQAPEVETTLPVYLSRQNLPGNLQLSLVLAGSGR